MSAESEPGRLAHAARQAYEMATNPAVLMSTLAAAAGANAARQVIQPPDAFGAEAKASQIGGLPLVFPLIEGVRERALADPANAGLKFVGPTDAEIRDGYDNMGRQPVGDAISKTQLKGTSTGGIKAFITQDNERTSGAAASFQSPEDLDGTLLKSYLMDFDLDLFLKKDVRARIVRVTNPTPNGRGSTITPHGSWKAMPNWDNLAPANLARVHVGTNVAPTIDPRHTGGVTLKPKRRLTAEQRQSGKYYVEVEQSCVVRDPVYDASGKGCDEVEQRFYRIKGSNTTYDVRRNTSKPGDLITRVVKKT